MNGWIAQDGNVRKVDAGSPATGLLSMDMKAVWSWCLSGLAAALSIGVLALAVDFLVRAQPTVGGVDFYFYLLYARDLAKGLPDVLPERYIYFPGVYTFWESVFRLSDGGFATLQWAYLSVVMVNGLLVGIILSTLTRYWQAGVLATGGYLIIAGRLDGLAGITEPLATVPYLLGLWLWIVLREQSKSPFDLVALGAGLGLALYAKQQGGLLSIGALGLLPAMSSGFSVKPYTMRQLLLLPMTTAGVFLLAMIGEGGGMEAIRRGVMFVQAYPAQGTWAEHVSRIFEITQPVSNLFLSGCVLWGISLIAGRRRRDLPETVLLTLGLTTFSVAGCLFQYVKRGYQHYALLALPPALIAAALAMVMLFFWLRVLAHSWPRFGRAGVLAGALLFLGINSVGTTAFAKDAVTRMTTIAERTVQAELGKPFEPLCAKVRTGAALLTIPPRENRVHWFCQTRSIAWKVPNPWEQSDPRMWEPLLADPSLDQVFVFSTSYGPFEQAFLDAGDWSGFFQELTRRGYLQTLDYEVGRLYQRFSQRPSR